MKQPITPWTWTSSRELAASLTADARLSNQQIAEKAGVGVSTYKRWREAPEFEKRVAELIEKYQAKLATVGYAKKEHRILRREKRLRAIQETMDQRAKAYAFAEVKLPGGKKKRFAIPGGNTGLVVIEPKAAGDQYSVDTGLMSEERALLVEIAIEVGDWKTKVEHSGRIGGEISEEAIELAKLFPIEVIEAAQERLRASEREKASS